jgi:hypothetical protein
MKTRLWTWSGKCFGYRDGDDLWTHDGLHVSPFRDEQAFSIEMAIISARSATKSASFAD